MTRFEVLDDFRPSTIAAEGITVADDYEPVLSSCQSNIDASDVV